MELIDIFQIIHHQQHTHSHSQLFATISLLIKELPIQYIKSENHSFQFSLQIKRIGRLTIMGRVKLMDHNCIEFSLSTFIEKIQNCLSHHQRIKCLKSMFKMNQNLYSLNLKIKPGSGEMIINGCYFFPLNQLKVKQPDIIQFFINVFENMVLQFETVITQILFSLNLSNLNQKSQNQKSHKILNQLKTFVKSSNHYTWNVLEGSTKSKQKDKKLIYDQKKAKFRKVRKQRKTNKLISTLDQISNQSIPIIKPFFMLKIHQDEQLKTNYLSGRMINKQQKLLNEIKIQPEQIKLLKQGKVIKIKTNQNEKIKVMMLNDHYSIAQKYEHKILKSLTQFQFSGIPKYYYHKNQKGQPNYVLTNLIDVLGFYQFIQKNKVTISLNTKFILLSQITNFLRYLRDHSIIYHNLLPKNIFIKRGLVVKTIDFTNCYQEQIYASITPEQQIQMKQMSFRPFQNKFPYVCNLLNCRTKTFNDERADVYSLGVILYEILFQKTPINCKFSSNIKIVQENDQINLMKNLVIDINKFGQIHGDIGKILGSFILSAISIESINQTQLSINLKLRPYLDWFIIIIKHLCALPSDF